MQLYTDLTPWYRLIDPPADHLDEATAYLNALLSAVPDARTLFDIGSGGGHNVWHLKKRLQCTLADISPQMLALSRELNPECEHHQGDLRSIRLGRQFDTVLVHDAIAYMTNRADLRAAADTAFAHTRPGGAAVFAPDVFAENFRDHTNLLSEDEPGRSIRGMEWCWDADPHDEICQVEYAFLLRDASGVRMAHDRHTEGLFSKAVWTKVLSDAGFEVATFPRPLDDDGEFDEVFLCRRPPNPP